MATHKKVPRKRPKPVRRDRPAEETAPPPSDVSFPVVGIGASAGGLEAFTQLLSHLPLDTGMAFVLVQHLDPEHESALVQILGRAATLPVREITDNLPVEPNHVYVIPRNTGLSIERGTLKLRPRKAGRMPHRPIDEFFESLAQDRRERAIGVVLSGTATDGTQGLESIKAAGGLTFAQDDSAKHDSMPRSAIAAGVVDFVLSPRNIAAELARIARHPFVAGQPPFFASEEETAEANEGERHAETDVDSAIAHEDDQAALPSGGSGKAKSDGKRVRDEARHGREQSGRPQAERPAENGYKKILLLLRGHSGVDFSLYRSTTIQRRIARRLVVNKKETLEEYAQFLKGNSQELDALYSDVLISVTSFFRNPEAFDVLQRDVLPGLLNQRSEEPIRVWVLGCSTGQEAYSIAMAFVESAEKAPRARPLQIFATDLNDKLLEKARNGLYAKSLAEDISPERLCRFFVEEEGGYRISKRLREMVVFARQNLIADPPFSRMDLISCRNLLIYLEPSLQQRALPTFHYALKPHGVLLLGASESVGSFTDLFEPLDRKYKIFAKKPAATPSLHLPARTQHAGFGVRLPTIVPGEAGQLVSPPTGLRGELNAQREADRVAVAQFAPPSVLINDENQILQFRGPTGAYLEPPAGKATFDVLKMAREGLMLPLRTAINKARKENKTARTENVRVKRNGDTRTVNVQVIPLKNVPERCFLIVFEDAEASAGGGSSPSGDVAKAPPLSKKQEASRSAELEAELAETREYLQAVQEQGEASNEELQAANEEVQSANEELQSINEELETSKEELESANEELTTVNEEMANRNAELNRLNNDLVNLQNSTRLAILLLGRDLTLRRFSPQAEKQFDLLATDLGRPIGHVRHNLLVGPAASGNRPDEDGHIDLERMAAEVIDQVREQECEVKSRQGHWFSLRARPYMTLDNKVDGAVFVLVDIDDLRRAKQVVADARDYAQNTVDTVRDPMVVLDKHLRVESANRSFYKIFHVAPSQTVGRLIYDLGNHQWDIPKLRELLEKLLPECNTMEDYQVEYEFESIGRRMMLLNARRMRDPQQQGTERILLAIEDVTEALQNEQNLRLSEVRYRQLFQAAQDGILILDANSGKIIDANSYMSGLTGLDYEALLGKELYQIGMYRDIEANKEAFRTLQRDKYLRCDQLPLQNQRGEQIEVEMIANVYQEGHGLVAQCNVRDITERVAMEHQIKVQSEQLAGESRRKDEFLAMLSHELRNPLAPIRSAIHLLRSQERSAIENPLQKQAHEIIERQAGNLTKLVNDLLEVSRVISGRIRLNLQTVDMNQVVAHAVQTVTPLVEERKHKLVLNLWPDAVWCNADATRLEEIFINLLNNAAKYTPDGGRIEVWCEQPSGTNDAQFRVRDNGVGIDAELRPRIFDLFTQADRSLAHSEGGLGIGLSLAHRLVSLHGGTIEVHSPLTDGTSDPPPQEAGPHRRGTEFLVKLTLTPQPTGAIPDVPNDVAAQPTGLRVLLVDDNVDLVFLLASSLRQRGYNVQSAHNGPDGLKLAEQWQPNVIVLDIGLPGIDGYELARRLRAHPATKAARMIALTGYGRDTDVTLAHEAGFDAHLVKPYEFQMLEKLMLG